MNELEQQLWKTANPIFLEVLSEEYGQAVGPRCLPIAAKILRIEYASCKVSSGVEDFQGFIDRLPSMIRNIVRNQDVKDCSIAIKISEQGENCAQFGEFLKYSYDLANPILENSNPSIDPATLIGAGEKVITRIFGGYDPEEHKNLQQPKGDNFFVEACCDYVSRIPKSLNDGNVLEWKPFLKKRVKDRLSDALGLKKFDISVATSSTPMGFDDFGEDILISAFSFEEWQSQEKREKNGGKVNLVKKLTRLVSRRFRNDILSAVYELHHTAYIPPDEFTPRTRELCENFIEQLEKDYNDAQAHLLFEVSKVERARQDVEEAENALKYTRDSAEYQIDSAAVDLIEKEGKALFVCKRIKESIDRISEAKISDEIKSVLRSKKSNMLTLESYLEVAMVLQERMYRHAREYKPVEALKEYESWLNSVDKILVSARKMGQQVDLRKLPFHGALQEKIKETQLRRIACQLESKRDYLFRLCNDRDSNLNRYRARRSCSSNGSDGGVSIDTNTHWVRSQSVLMELLRKAGYNLAQSSLSEKLKKARNEIERAAVDYAIRDKHIDIFLRNDLLDVIKESFEQFFQITLERKYSWEESSDCFRTRVSRGPLRGAQIDNLTKVTGWFHRIQFSFQFFTKNARDELRISIRRGRIPSNLRIINHEDQLVCVCPSQDGGKCMKCGGVLI